jgi:porin
MQVSPRELELENDARAKLKGTGRSTPDEGVFEVNYGYQIMPYMTLSPNVQYIVNPDNSGFTKINFVPKNIVTIGLQLTLGVSKILGFAGLGAGGD